jgi:parallel beta-helix repeat protein
VLKADLVNCSGDGLVIGANGITIDLNHHRIDGIGHGAGVSNRAQHRRVTIRNGTIHGFDTGLYMPGTAYNRFSRIRLAHNDSAGILLTGRANRIRSSVVSRNGVGIFVSGPTNDIAANAVTRNPISVSGVNNHVTHNVVSRSSGGILLTNALGSEVKANTLSDINDDGGIVLTNSNGNQVKANVVSDTTGSGGIVLSDSTANKVEGNTVAGIKGFGRSGGIVLDHSTGNRIEDDTVLDSTGDGIAVLRSDGNHIERNSTFDNTQAGIAVTDFSSHNVVQANDTYANGRGLSLDEGSANEVAGNSSHNNVLGISVENSAGWTLFSRLERNAVSGNSDDGIRVTDRGLVSGLSTIGTLLAGNVADANGGDGIDVQIGDPATRLVGNSASGNHEIGIAALAGVRDGGGNVAIGNWIAQCSAGVVVCS